MVLYNKVKNGKSEADLGFPHSCKLYSTAKNPVWYELTHLFNAEVGEGFSDDRDGEMM